MCKVTYTVYVDDDTIYCWRAPMAPASLRQRVNWKVHSGPNATRGLRGGYVVALSSEGKTFEEYWAADRSGQCPEEAKNLTVEIEKAQPMGLHINAE